MSISERPSIIQNILDDTIKLDGKNKKGARGLDYAAYAVMAPPVKGKGGGLEVVNEARNESQLSDRLDRFACSGRTPDQQFDTWKELLGQVDKALRSLDGEFIKTGQGETVRVVFDIDMGGIYYTRIGTHAVLFGATLDQEEVNNGRCEREMYRMVAQIEDVCTAHGE
jgi:hypothetical protein